MDSLTFHECKSLQQLLDALNDSKMSAQDWMNAAGTIPESLRAPIQRRTEDELLAARGVAWTDTEVIQLVPRNEREVEWLQFVAVPVHQIPRGVRFRL